MKVLTEQQQDALKELINMGFSRTAASLSDLTGDRVLLEVPNIAIHPIEELLVQMSEFIEGEVATVSQIFTGSMSGTAVLLLNYEGAVILTDLLSSSQDPALTRRLDASDCEVLTEVGNILLNACLSVFGNLLQMYVSFSVPRLHLESLKALLDSLVIGKEEMRYAMVVYTAIRLRNNAIKGYLIIVLSVSSFDSFLGAVDNWAAL